MGELKNASYFIMCELNMLTFKPLRFGLRCTSLLKAEHHSVIECINKLVYIFHYANASFTVSLSTVLVLAHLLVYIKTYVKADLYLHPESFE